MDTTPRPEEVPDEPAEAAPVVTSHRPSPERVVFTEHDNVDGWIATDLAVTLDP